jgi:hypothetical protein
MCQDLVTFVTKSDCDLGTCRTTTITIAKLVDFDTSCTHSCKHNIKMDKILLVHSPWVTSLSKLLLEDRDLQIPQGYLTKFPWATFSLKLPLDEWDLEAQPSCPKNNPTFQSTWLEYFLSNSLRFQVFQVPFSLGTLVPNSWAKVTRWMNNLCVNPFYNLSTILYKFS